MKKIIARLIIFLLDIIGYDMKNGMISIYNLSDTSSNLKWSINQTYRRRIELK